MASHSLPEPYKLEFYGGGSQTFRTYEDVLAWAEEELRAWIALDDTATTQQLTGPYRQFPKQLISHIEYLVESAREAIADADESGEMWGHTRDFFNDFASGTIPVSRSAQGQLILRTWQQNPDLASAMLGLLRGQVPADKTVATAVRAAALMAAHDVGFDAIVQDEKASLQLLANDFSQGFDKEFKRQREAAEESESVNRDLKSAYDERKIEFNNALESHDAEMKRIETTFREQMRLRAPASFWRTKRNVHLGVASISLVVFGYLVYLALDVASTKGPDLWITIFQKDAGFTLGPALLISIPALAYFWLLKLIARIFVTNLASMASAGERATLISTFLALLLEEEGAIKDDERVLVLQAIFRPGPGDISDEGPPANWLDFLIKRAK